MVRVAHPRWAVESGRLRRWTIRSVAVAGTTIACALLLVACSSDPEPELEAAPSSTTATSSSTVVTTTTAEPPPLSVGMIRISDTVYELTVTCYAAGAGEVLAIGVGTAPDTGEPVEAYVQAYLGSPYVGLRIGVGEDSLIESSFDGSLDLYLQDDRIRASAIRFVRGLDLVTGAAEPAGVGQIEIECLHYETELPEQG